jgi:hypothetical protein
MENAPRKRRKRTGGVEDKQLCTIVNTFIEDISIFTLQLEPKVKKASLGKEVAELT